MGFRGVGGLRGGRSRWFKGVGLGDVEVEGYVEVLGYVGM